MPGTRHRPISASAEVAKGQVEPRRTAAVAVDPVWMLSVELADELPGVMEPGLNVAMAPVGIPLAERVTALENVPFCAVAVMVNCAVPPGWMVCGAVGELRVKVGGAVPVPLRLAVCGEPAALSATESVAEKVAAEAGVKVT